MSVIDDAVEANRRYAETFALGSLPMPPARKFAVVLCMDARINPLAALGLKEGDAHIIRNAGARMSEALRSIIISQVTQGTDAVALIHHTGCGMLSFTDAALRERLRAERGADASQLSFLAFTDLTGAVQDDLALYRSSPFVRQDIPLRGFIYDMETGLLREVPERAEG